MFHSAKRYQTINNCATNVIHLINDTKERRTNMQTFYDDLAVVTEGRDHSLQWLARIRKSTLEQIGVLQESVLAWRTWE